MGTGGAVEASQPTIISTMKCNRKAAGTVSSQQSFRVRSGEDSMPWNTIEFRCFHRCQQHSRRKEGRAAGATPTGDGRQLEEASLSHGMVRHPHRRPKAPIEGAPEDEAVGRLERPGAKGAACRGHVGDFLAQENISRVDTRLNQQPSEEMHPVESMDRPEKLRNRCSQAAKAAKYAKLGKR